MSTKRDAFRSILRLRPSRKALRDKLHLAALRVAADNSRCTLLLLW